MSKYSAMDRILFALTILPALVNGYDCTSMSNSDSCSDSSSLTGYSSCMVNKYSISAFIQCASQNGAPDFTATTDDNGGTKSISALDVLTHAVTTSNGLPAPGCGSCPLATNIPKAAGEHGSENFAKFLCNQYHPLDAGLCCLRNCLLVSPAAPKEHSIKAFCSDNRQDLMNEPTLPDSCGADPSDVAPAAAASQSDASSTTEDAISPSSGPMQSSSSSAISTTSPIANGAIPPSGTNTSPTPLATQKTGAASRRWGVGFARLNRLGFKLLPILTIF